MANNKTYNPCDDCPHSFSKNNQESDVCKICEFRQLLDKPTADVVEVKWISVKDELPKEKERVLVFLKNSGHAKGYTRIDTDRLIKGNWIRWGNCVTHWMPLPEPPKEGAENGKI